MRLEQAKTLMDRFVGLLSPVCIRIEPVGSVKRADKPEVHDIEILLIQKPGAPLPEFGRPKNVYKTHLDKLISDLWYDEIIRQASDKKDGERYKKFAIKGTGEMDEFCLDLFIVTPSTWGLQNMIRTGPSWFSHRAVTNRDSMAFNRQTGKQAYGFLPNDLKYIRAKDSPDKLSHIKRGDEVLSLPEERDVIELIFGIWIPPNERSIWARK